MDAQVTCCHTKVKLHNLTDIHTRWYPEWVQHDINWCSVWKVRHVFHRNDTGYNPLVSVTTSHLISDLDLTFLSDVDTNQHINARLQFITISTGKDLHVTNHSVGTVWHTQRGIADFTRLVTKDGMKQAFFSRKVFFTLRGHFTYKNIAFFNFRTDADNTHFIQIAQGIFPYVWNFAGNFFRAKLGVASF